MFAAGSNQEVCWPCGNVADAIFPEMLWSDLVIELHRVRGECFVKFFYQLDCALQEYQSGRQRHHFTPDDALTPPDMPDQDILQILSVTTSGAAPGSVTNLTWDDYVRVFCTALTMTVEWRSHRIDTSSCRVMVIVPVNHITEMIEAMADGFQEFRQGGRRDASASLAAPPTTLGTRVVDQHEGSDAEVDADSTASRPRPPPSRGGRGGLELRCCVFSEPIYRLRCPGERSTKLVSQQSSGRQVSLGFTPSFKDPWPIAT